jgi:hypothetical protein
MYCFKIENAHFKLKSTQYDKKNVNKKKKKKKKKKKNVNMKLLRALKVG